MLRSVDQHCLWILHFFLYSLKQVNIFIFYSVEIWVRDRTESKNEREQYFVKMLTNFAHPWSYLMNCQVAILFYSGVWLLIGTAHWWRTRALYTASWKDEKRWNDETPVTSAWPLHDKDGLHQLSAGFMWLFLCLGPFFIFCLFLFLLVKIPGLVLI